MNLKVIAARVALVIAGVVAAVFILETALFVSIPLFWKRLSLSDEKLGWKYVHTPKPIKRFFSGEGWAAFYINRDGFRSAEFNADKNSCRVMVLGDSVTFGVDVSQENLFTTLLEERLKRAYPDKNISVMNCGVAGFGTGQELLCLEEYGEKYPPDIIILMMFANDFDDNTATVYTNRFVPHFKLERGNLALYNKPSASQRIRTFLRDRSVLFYFIFHRLEMFDRILREKEKYPADEKYKTLLMRKILDEMRDYAGKRNIPFFIFYITKGKSDEPRFVEIRKYCGDNGIFFASVPQKEGELIPDNIHWSGRGHASAAEVIYEKISKSEILF